MRKLLIKRRALALFLTLFMVVNLMGFVPASGNEISSTPTDIERLDPSEVLTDEPTDEFDDEPTTTTTADDESNTTTTADDESNTTTTADDESNTTTTADDESNTTTTADNESNDTTTANDESVGTSTDFGSDDDSNDDSDDTTTSNDEKSGTSSDLGSGDTSDNNKPASGSDLPTQLPKPAPKIPTATDLGAKMITPTLTINYWLHDASGNYDMSKEPHHVYISGQDYARVPTVDDTDRPNGYLWFEGWHEQDLENGGQPALIEDHFDFDSIDALEEKVETDGKSIVLNVFGKFSDHYTVAFKNMYGEIAQTRNFTQEQLVMDLPQDEIENHITAGKYKLEYWVEEPTSEDDGYADYTADPDAYIQNPANKFTFGDKPTKNVTLVPYLKEIYNVVFYSEGLNIVEPQLVADGYFATVPDKSKNPTLLGYDFAHWSAIAPTEDEPKPGAFEFKTTPITDNTILYAVWTPKTVDYKVVYWVEKKDIEGDPGDNPNNYMHYRWEPKTALAGSSVNYADKTSDLVKELTEINVVVSGKVGEEKIENRSIVWAEFHHGETKTIAGNGDTVVNVYFSRLGFTYTFNLNQDTSNGSTTSNDKTTDSYSDPISSYTDWKRKSGSSNQSTRTETQTRTRTQIESSNGSTQSKYVASMLFNDATYQQGGTTTLKYTFTAKYEQNIENIWPSSANATITAVRQIQTTTSSRSRSREQTRSRTQTKTGTNGNITNGNWSPRNGWNNNGDWSGWTQLNESTGDWSDDLSTLKTFVAWDTPKANVAATAGFVSKRISVIAEMLPLNGKDVEINATWGTTYLKQVNYWLEELPEEKGKGIEKTFDRVTKNYVKSSLSQAINLDTNGLSAKGIEGANYVGTETTGSNNGLADIYDFYYTRNRHTLSFNTVGGSAVASVKVMYGAQLFKNSYLPANNPTKIAYGITYIFDGWYLDSDYYMPFDETLTMPDNDLVLYAKWSSTQYAVKFYDAIGGTEIKAVGKGHNEAIDPENDPPYQIGEGVPEKGKLTGWYWSSTQTGGKIMTTPYAFDSMTVMGDTNLYAQWKTDGFKIKYDFNGGSFSTLLGATSFEDPSTYNLNGDLLPVQWSLKGTPTPPAGSPAGTVFIGWKMLDGDGTIYYPGRKINVYSDITFVAFYANPAEMITVIYHSNISPDTEHKERHSVSESTFLLPGKFDEFDNANYEFKYWTRQSADEGDKLYEGDEFSIAGYLAGSTVHLYAQWEKTTNVLWVKTVWNGKPAGTKLDYADVTIKNTVLETSFHIASKINVAGEINANTVKKYTVTDIEDYACADVYVPYGYTAGFATKPSIIADNSNENLSLLPGSSLGDYVITVTVSTSKQPFYRDCSSAIQGEVQ